MAKKKSKKKRVRVFRRGVLSKYFGKKICLSRENRRVRVVFDYVGLLRGYRQGDWWDCDVLLKIYPKGGRPAKLIIPYTELLSFIKRREPIYLPQAHAVSAVWKSIGEPPKDARAEARYLLPRNSDGPRRQV